MFVTYLLVTAILVVGFVPITLAVWFHRRERAVVPVAESRPSRIVRVGRPGSRSRPLDVRNLVSRCREDASKVVVNDADDDSDGAGIID